MALVAEAQMRSSGCKELISNLIARGSGLRRICAGGHHNQRLRIAK